MNENENIAWRLCWFNYSKGGLFVRWARETRKLYYKRSTLVNTYTRARAHSLTICQWTVEMKRLVTKWQNISDLYRWETISFCSYIFYNILSSSQCHNEQKNKFSTFGIQTKPWTIKMPKGFSCLKKNPRAICTE